MSEAGPARTPAELRALPVEALPALCAELREEIIHVCGLVGGHLGASLGAVELIVGLHRVFRSPVDRLVFDVGHQAYAHKLLTGRGPRFHTLRQAGGVAPFLDPAESEHDAFGAGHACTAISVGLGLLEGKRIAGAKGQVVAVVGDGAMTGGLSFEGLNNASVAAGPLKVVLNDNGMSISENVGAIVQALRSNGRALFESLGFTYLGPVDGHDFAALLPALEALRDSPRPAVLHVRTEKGRGFQPAESDPRTRGHAMGPYEWRAGKLVRSRQGHATFSDVFADALTEAMAADARVVAVTPAMLEGSSLVALKARFGDRVHDVGIAEQHALAFAAGLAREGARPVVAIYSTFLQRGFDQLVHEIALPGLPVVLAVDRAGLVGADGATHQGAYDVAMARALPGVAVASPVWGDDVAPLLRRALESSGPTAIRFPRGTVSARPEGTAAPSGKARWLRGGPGARVTLVTSGPLGLAALEAASPHPDWAVLDASWVSPLDREAVLATGGALVVAEEATTRGGLGEAVLSCLARAGATPRVRVLGLPDERFVPHGEARAQRAALGLDAAGLEQAALSVLA